EQVGGGDAGDTVERDHTVYHRDRDVGAVDGLNRELTATVLDRGHDVLGHHPGGYDVVGEDVGEVFAGEQLLRGEAERGEGVREGVIGRREHGERPLGRERLNQP